jgi:crotonobetainyl-CoA:carnitine CoA-transferase CaiB-like acyl-CoA transferase
MSAALEGVLVLDFTNLLPGPLATQLLAQAGARVVKVERPGGGDEQRVTGPPYRDSSAYFAVLNEGKELLAVDLKSGDRSQLDDLVRTCDVLVEQFRPGVMKRLGLGEEDVRRVNPSVVYCSITGYGQDGPLAATAGHDLNYLAASGVLSLTEEPTLPPVLIADLAGAALPAVIDISLALLRRARTGEGSRLDVAMARNLFALLPYQIARGFLTGKWPQPGDDTVTGASPRYRVYEASDGRHVAVAPLEDRFWARFCELAGLSQASTVAEVAARIAAEPSGYWAQLLEDEDTCSNVVRTMDESVRHPQFAALFEQSLHPGAPIPRLPLPHGGVAAAPIVREKESS